jgi:hypothetical protein
MNRANAGLNDPIPMGLKSGPLQQAATPGARSTVICGERQFAATRGCLGGASPAMLSNRDTARCAAMFARFVEDTALLWDRS